MSRVKIALISSSFIFVRHIKERIILLLQNVIKNNIRNLYAFNNIEGCMKESELAKEVWIYSNAILF